MLRVTKKIMANFPSDPNFFTARISTITTKGSQRAPVKIFSTKLDSPLKYKPGQWADFDNLQPNSRLLGLSMINYDPNSLEFACKLSPHSTVQWIHQNMQVDDEIHLQLGLDQSFTLNLTEKKNIVFIAGGIGITPFMSMLDYLSKQQQNHASNDNNFLLINIVKTEEDNIFSDRLKEYNQAMKNLKVQTIAASRNDLNKTMEHCQKILENTVDINDTRCYICGPEMILKESYNLLTRMGCSEIVVEKWAEVAFDLSQFEEKHKKR